MLIAPYYQTTLPARPMTAGQLTVSNGPFYQDIRFQLGILGIGFVLAVTGKLIKWFAYESLGKTIGIVGASIFGIGLALFVWVIVIMPIIRLVRT